MRCLLWRDALHYAHMNSKHSSIGLDYFECRSRMYQVNKINERYGVYIRCFCVPVLLCRCCCCCCFLLCRLAFFFLHAVFNRLRDPLMLLKPKTKKEAYKEKLYIVIITFFLLEKGVYHKSKASAVRCDHFRIRKREIEGIEKK